MRFKQSRKMATGNVKLYQVRLARDSAKKYHAMRFKQKVDISQLTAPIMTRREREGEEEEAPTHGEGSEYGRKRREASRRRRHGYGTKDTDPDDQPWELREGKKNGKLFTGRKEGGVNMSSAYYMMRQCADGAFEAIPISSWYNFTPGIQYNTFNAEEAEEKYLLKHKTLNYFSLMLSKKMQNNQEGEGEGEGGGSRRLRVTDIDGGKGNSSDEDGPMAREDTEEGGASKAKQRHQKGKKPRKSRADSDGGSSDETTDDGELESREVDYISDDSSESEREEKEDERQMEDAQQRGKVGESDSSDGEEEEEAEEELTEAGKEINALIKKQQSVDAPSSDEGDGDGEGEGEGEEADAMDQGAIPSRSKGTKRGMEEDGVGQGPSQPLPKRVHVEENLGVITDKEVLHYLARKPITTKDLVRKFQRRKTSMDKRQVVESLGNILPRLKVEKKKIKDKIYLSLRPSK